MVDSTMGAVRHREEALVSEPASRVSLSASMVSRRLEGSVSIARSDPKSKEVFAEILRHPPHQQTVLFPALGMPLLVWVMAGDVLIREREAGGAWTQLPVERGHIFLTTSGKPYELSWAAEGREEFVVMHVCLGID